MKSRRKPTRILPPADFLRECFTYNRKNGGLRWKARPRKHFNTDGDWSKWNTRYAGAVAGNISVHGYRIVAVGHRLYRAQRLVWKMMTGEEPPEQVDHKDGDPLNNRWANLRAASQTESNWNSRTRKCVSGRRGVSRNGSSRWMAQITIAGVQHYLGTFVTIEEASAAYEAFARKLHGEFYRPR